MLTVNIHEAKTHLSRYIDRALQGEVIVVCRHNQPVAELRAVETSPVRRPRVAGLIKGQVHWEPGTFDPMTDAELAAKFTDNSEPRIGAAETARLLAACWNVESLEDFPGLVQMTGLRS